MRHKLIAVLLLCVVISNGYESQVHATTTDPKVSQSLLHPDPCTFKAKVTPKEKRKRVKLFIEKPVSGLYMYFKLFPLQIYH